MADFLADVECEGGMSADEISEDDESDAKGGSLRDMIVDSSQEDEEFTLSQNAAIAAATKAAEEEHKKEMKLKLQKFIAAKRTAKCAAQQSPRRAPVIPPPACSSSSEEDEAVIVPVRGGGGGGGGGCKRTSLARRRRIQSSSDEDAEDDADDDADAEDAGAPPISHKRPHSPSTLFSPRKKMKVHNTSDDGAESPQRKPKGPRPIANRPQPSSFTPPTSTVTPRASTLPRPAKSRIRPSKPSPSSSPTSSKPTASIRPPASESRHHLKVAAASPQQTPPPRSPSPPPITVTPHFTVSAQPTISVALGCGGGALRIFVAAEQCRAPTCVEPCATLEEHQERVRRWATKREYSLPEDTHRLQDADYREVMGRSGLFINVHQLEPTDRILAAFNLGNIRKMLPPATFFCICASIATRKLCLSYAKALATLEEARQLAGADTMAKLRCDWFAQLIAATPEGEDVWLEAVEPRIALNTTSSTGERLSTQVFYGRTGSEISSFNVVLLDNEATIFGITPSNNSLEQGLLVVTSDGPTLTYSLPNTPHTSAEMLKAMLAFMRGEELNLLGMCTIPLMNSASEAIIHVRSLEQLPPACAVIKLDALALKTLSEALKAAGKDDMLADAFLKVTQREFQLRAGVGGQSRVVSVSLSAFGKEGMAEVYEIATALGMQLQNAIFLCSTSDATHAPANCAFGAKQTIGPQESAVMGGVLERSMVPELINRGGDCYLCLLYDDDEKIVDEFNRFNIVAFALLRSPGANHLVVETCSSILE